MEIYIGFIWFVFALLIAFAFGMVACFVMFWTGDIQFYDLMDHDLTELNLIEKEQKPNGN